MQCDRLGAPAAADELAGWTTRSYDSYAACHDPLGVVLASLLVTLGQ